MSLDLVAVAAGEAVVPVVGDLALLDGDPGPAAAAPAAGGPTGAIRVDTLRDLRGRPPEKLPLIGGRRLVRGEILSVAARAGFGKSTWTRGVLANGAVGRPYCGIEFTEPIRSIFFSGEGSAALWQEAMLRAASAFGLDDEALSRIEVVEGGGPTGLRLNRPADLDRIRRVLAAAKDGTGLDLVVFDPFQRFAPGDENSSRDMGAAVDALLAVNREFAVASIVPHHASQAGRGLDAFRGHTTFEGAIATGLVLTAPEPGERVLEAPKVRYARTAADTATIFLDFDQEAGVYVERPGLGAKTKTGQVMEAVEDGEWHKVNDLADDLGIPRTTFRDSYIAPAVERGVVETKKAEKNALVVRRADPATMLLEGAR